MTTLEASALAARAAAATDATADLRAELRCLLAGVGFDLVAVRADADGTLELVVRFGVAAVPDAEPAPAGSLAGEDLWSVPPAPDPPFVSPILYSAPFEGDGTGDLLRLAAEAEDDVRIPDAGAAGELPPPVTPEARARMLASTITGDAVLALMHDGGADDPARFAAVLQDGWERYGIEVRRLGFEPDAAVYARAGDVAVTMIAEAI